MVDDISKIPTPTYDYEISVLLSYYDQALNEITTKLERLALTDFERAQVLATQAEIQAVLAELSGQSTAWVASNIPVAAADGVAISLVSLGLAETIGEARQIVKFNKLNRDFIKTAVADTQEDLLQISQNVDRKVRMAIREATAEVMRANLTQGINGTQSLRRDLLSRLDQATKTGIIDASGRRWKPEVYVDTIVRTKMAYTQRETAVNDALGRNVLYGVISRHSAKDMCLKWEGKIVRLTRDAPGDYPFIGDLPRREIFHPRCLHVVSPVRKPERYLEDTSR